MRAGLSGLVTAAVLVILSGCATTARNGFTLEQWESPTLFRGQFITPPASEVLYVAREIAAFKQKNGRWPEARELVDFVTNQTAHEFVSRNVAISPDSKPLQVVVWDLSLRKNTLKFDESGRIWIYSEVFGTGSRKLMHGQPSQSKDFVERLIESIH